MVKGLVNGTSLESVSLMDRGLLYGDGLFETIRILDKKPVLFHLHIHRLFEGLKRLQIDPGFDENLLIAEMDFLISKSKPSDTIIKIIVTRGESGRGYTPAQTGSPTRILQIFPTPEFSVKDFRSGVRVKVLSTRLGLNPALAGIKHLNRLEQVMGSAELGENFAEGIMLDTNGQVRDGTRSNIFYVKDHELITPEVQMAGVAGVMREYILSSVADLNMSCRIVDHCEPQNLYDSKELIICNSVYGILPVRELVTEEGSRQYDEPDLTRKLQQLVSSRLGMVQG